MPMPTILTERLGLTHPIVQAPLAGGGDTPELVAAVSEAGGLGCIGAAYLTPSQISERARAHQPTVWHQSLRAAAPAASRGSRVGARVGRAILRRTRTAAASAARNTRRRL